jgi:hypothetical protein
VQDFDMTDFPDQQTKRQYGIGGLETEALEVLRLIVWQAERGETLDADLIEQAKAIVGRYDRALVRGHEALNVASIRKEDIT